MPEKMLPRPPAHSFWLAFLAYVIPTFPIGYIWHLVLFADVYERLGVYRDDILIPFGVLSMCVQGALYSFLYPRLFADGSKVLRNGLLYGLGLGLLSWSFMAVAVSAKHVMSSVPVFLTLETGFVAVQYLVVGPLIAWAYRS